MGRISVSLPDELLARLEPVKEKINVSHVCREALERRIDGFERAAILQSEELDILELTDRLREERALVEGKFEAQGRRNAATWVVGASYLELRKVGENHDSFKMERYKLPRAAFRSMKNDMEEATVSCEGVHAVAYKTAWLDYVRAVWAQVTEQMEQTQTNHTEPVAAEVTE